MRPTGKLTRVNGQYIGRCGIVDGGASGGCSTSMVNTHVPSLSLHDTAGVHASRLSIIPSNRLFGARLHHCSSQEWFVQRQLD